MENLEDLETKEKLFQDFFTWLFNNSHVKNKNIKLISEIDVSLARDYNDPYIYYPEQFNTFFQTLAMKRLDRISQLSLSINTFPNTFHSRLEHSKGVYNRKLEEFVYNYQKPEWKKYIEDNDLKLYLIAELIKIAGHDIGHFPLSHAFEEQLFCVHGPHEILGKRIMLESPEIKSALSNISDELPTILDELYSNNLLNFKAHDESSYDVDRLDYVSRDSLYAGKHVSLKNARYISFPEVSKTNTFVDAYLPEELHEIEKLLLARKNGYDNIYMSEDEQAFECSIGSLLKVIKSNPDSFSEVGTDLCNFLKTLNSTSIDKIPLEEFLSWDDIRFYKEVFDIAEKHPDENIRDLATLVLPQFEAFLNTLYNLMDFKHFKADNYSKSDLQFLSRLKSLIASHSLVLKRLSSRNFARKNIIILTDSPYEQTLNEKGLTSNFDYKFKAYNPNEPIYIQTHDGNYLDLANHPDRSHEWNSEKKQIHYSYAYIPYLKMQGIPDTTIEQIKNSGREISADSFNTELKVNMAPLKAGNSIVSHFENMNLSTSDEPNR